MSNTSLTKTHQFSISYDFDKTSEHRINAEELGSSLVNLALAIQEGDKILNGEDSDVSVDVVANKPGSFMVDVITQAIVGHKDIIQILGLSLNVGAIGIANVLAALKVYKNRKVEVEQQKEDGSWQVTFEDGESVDISNDIKELVNNYNFRKKLDGIITRPASSAHEGSIKFIEKNETGDETITNEVPVEESIYFKAPPKKSLSSESVTEENTNIRFTNIALENKTGWKIRLADDSVVPVTMDDEAFLERINTRENAVIKGDLFEVKLRTTVRETNGKTSTSRSIIRVVRHRVDSSRKLISDES